MNTEKNTNEVAQQVMKNLQIAKSAVIFCLENPKGYVDMHGLSFWAQRVEELREEIQKYL